MYLCSFHLLSSIVCETGLQQGSKEQLGFSSVGERWSEFSLGICTACAWACAFSGLSVRLEGRCIMFFPFSVKLFYGTGLQQGSREQLGFSCLASWCC